MDVVLGVALLTTGPATIHTVLVSGGHGDGVTVEENSVAVTTEGSDEGAAVDAAIAAILRAHETARAAGLRLVSAGVTVTDPRDAAALSSRLATDGIADVMLVSPTLAAASLARTMGRAAGCDRMALLSVEPADTTLAVVNCADGAITRVFRQGPTNPDATGALDTIAAALTAPGTCADGLLLVCSGGDAASLRPQLEAAVRHVVRLPGEPAAVLARGAALASAHLTVAAVTPVAFEAGTAPLAYTQDPGSGGIGGGYYDVPDIAAPAGFGSPERAYSAVPDEDDAAATEVIDAAAAPVRRPLLVAGAALAAVVFAAASALMIALTLDITPNLVSLRPDLGRVLAAPLAPPILQGPAAQPLAPQSPVLHRAVGDVSAPAVAVPTVPATGSVPPPVLSAPAPVTGPAAEPVAGPPLPRLDPPAHAVATPAPFRVPPALPVTPPLVMPDFSKLFPAPPETMPTPQEAKPLPPVVIPNMPAVKPNPPVVKPLPPVVIPSVPVVKPVPPVVGPSMPVIKPNPPIVVPSMPAVKPDPPVVVPSVPVIKPDPPVVVPPVPVIKPDPPIVKPIPPITLPTTPASVPTPPVVVPSPPVSLPTPPISLPAPQSPVSLPIPSAPAIPLIPTPSAPAIPLIPAPSAPAIPLIPAPSAPALPNLSGGLPGLGGAPSAPSMPNLFGGGGLGGLFGGGGLGGLFGAK